MTQEELNDNVEKLEALLDAGFDLGQVEQRTRELIATLELAGTLIGSVLHIRLLHTLSTSLYKRSRAIEALPIATLALELCTQGAHWNIHGVSLGILGIIHWHLADYPRAQEYYKEALVADEALGNMAGVAKHLGCIGNVHLRISECTLALDYYTRALAIVEELGDNSNAAMWLGNIGSVHNRLCDYPRALEYYRKTLAIYEELGRKASAALMLSNIGTVYSNLSEHEQALDFYSRAMALFEELGDKVATATLLGNIGIVYAELSDYVRALDYYAKALVIDEELGNKASMAIRLGNIGIIHANISDFNRALDYYERALTIAQDTGDKASVALHLGNMGNVFRQQEDFDNAFDFINRALTQAEAIGDRRQVGYWLHSLGLLYETTNQPETALEYLLRALSLRRDELHTNEAVVSTLVNIGAIQRAQGEIDKAITSLEEALVLSVELGEKAPRYMAHKELAHVYSDIDDYQQAYEHLNSYHELEREVLSEEATRQAQLMENRRKVDESERDRQVKLARFQEQEKILNNILPSRIAQRIVDGEKTIAEAFDDVSIFFSDIVGFTKLSQSISAQELVQTLNAVFSEFDVLARKHGLEKIKTIGDSYMAVCGAPEITENHAECVARFAIDLLESVERLNESLSEPIHIRIGLHCGSVVAGVIGENKFAYDLWGDAVNVASRMESHGESSRIHCSYDFAHHLRNRDASFVFEERGEMEIKGKGMMRTYFLVPHS